jgi:DNA-binding NarL/FixJ family response regulator
MTRVFLVDDSSLIRDRLRAMFAGLSGVEAAGEASGADDAIAAILEQRPEVVLLDVNLAQGSGFDVLRAVHPQAPQIDFYMLSNFATDAYRRTATQLGARGFFDKTQEFAQLMDVLAQRARAA